MNYDPALPDTDPSRGRVAWLDAAKGLSILLVVFHHSCMEAGDLGVGWDIYALLDGVFKPIRMPLFFTVSGIFAASAMERSWSSLLHGKVSRLLYLYGLWTAIYWIYYRVADPGGGTDPLGRSTTQLVMMWLVPVSGQWFLWLLAIYFVMARALKPYRHPATFMLIGIVSVIASAKVGHVPHYSWRNAMAYAPFFLGGVWYGARIREVMAQAPFRLMVAGGLLYALVMVIYPDATRFATGVDGLKSFSGLLAVMGGVFLLCRVGPVRAGLSFFGRNTLPIYLMHGLVVTAAGMLLGPTIHHLAMPSLWLTPGLSVVALAVSLWLHRMSGAFGATWLYSNVGLSRILRAFRERSRTTALT